MNVNKIENKKYTPAFGIKLGINLNEKIMLAKQRQAFSPEHLKNLEKIEADGINAILEITDKLVISSVNNKKASMIIKKTLVLKNEFDKVDICDMSNIYQPVDRGTRSIFHIHKFLRIFNDDFNLQQKIEKAWEKLSK